MKILLRVRHICLVFIAVCPVLVFAQPAYEGYALKLGKQRISTSENAQHWLDSIRQTKLAGATQVIIQFYKIPDASTRQKLSNAGIMLMDYIPDNAYTALIQLPSVAAEAKDLSIRSVVNMSANWKIDERILARNGLKADESTDALVSFVRGVSDIEALEIIAGYKAQITDKRFAPAETFRIRMPYGQIISLAGHALVKYIGLPSDAQPLNFDARSSSGANLLYSPAATGGYQLDGAGVTVGVGDNTSGIYHIDIRDRLINFNPAGPSMHGVHTTTTVAGKGIMDPRMVGMAPAAFVLNHIYDVVWAQTPAMFHDYNMTLTNNSYAAVIGDCSFAGTYDQYAQMLDQYEKDFPYVQHVFASGNDGLLQCGSFPAGYATVTGGYQPSKNVLTIGGVTKYHQLWPKSSRGPVKDGRLKPELMGYGFALYSGDVYDNYGNSNGTSMSCPIVTGNLALLEQRYKQLHSNQNIPSDLLKALAMNGATDMGNPGPDYTYGYGLVNTYRSVQMLDNNRYLRDSVKNGALKTHLINVPPNVAQLKVMLYWHDDAASPLSSKALVNDLDLQLVDPAAGTHLPFILDPNPANVGNNALNGVDTLNNSEQIVINIPAAGTYSVRVQGTLVPATTQPYVVVYDFLPVGLKMKYPVTGVTVPGNDSIYIYWDASDDPNSFTLEYSSNNGTNWNLIDANVPSAQRHYVWYTPNISSSQCVFRIKRNNTAQQDVTGTFVVNPAPVVQLSAIQCPGYMSIEWSGVSGASGYEVLKKIGDDLRPIDTVTATNYILSGLPFDSIQYAGVRPLINGVPGWRSKSVKRLPSDGNCSGSISDGDLKADTLFSPLSGRLATSSALTANETLSVRVRNLDDAPANSYKVSYSVNGGPWQSQNALTAIPAAGSSVVSFSGLNLAAAGTYELRVAVENLGSTDAVNTNDTIVKFIRQLNNPPVNISNIFTEDFEGAGAITVLKDSIGVLPNDHWDYINSTDSGRLRTLVSNDILISGQRSLSMDLLMNKEDNQNYLTGTFNLQAFNVSNTEVRLEFDYKLHGKPKYLAGNEVWVRGSDTQPWVNIYTFDTSLVPGQVKNTGSLSVTNALLNAGQNLSSSFQIRIGQHDTSVIAMNEYGNGLTMDNLKLYSVKNDVQLLEVVSPHKLNCDVDSAVLAVRVYNSDNLPQDTVALFYQYDNGPIVKDTIFNIAAKDTLLHSFKPKLSTAAIGLHTINIWLVAQGDTYLPNDSILNFTFRNQPNVTVFPYLEDFEQGDGQWYSEGINSSWGYGTPNSPRLRKAASGNKAWATNLSGNYNDNEQSYLYSPCFDIASLSNPMLSFSLTTNIENCGTSVCDGAWVEYSADGTNWTKLGSSGEGYNWYGSSQVWNDSATRWRVASIPLPKDVPSLKLRFVMKSDAGTVWDGIAVDDIHVFDLKHSIYEGNNTSASNNINSGGLVDFTSDNKIMVQLMTDKNLGSGEAKIFAHSYVLNPVLRRYSAPRNYVINTTQAVTDSVTVRLYITDMEVLKMVNDQSCDSCSKAEDAYRLGITKYSDSNKGHENGSLTDNTGGIYTFIPHTVVKWVPYESGYYAQVKINSLSEFWFNTGLPGVAIPGMTLYPNPISDGKFNIIWTGLPGAEFKIVMFDVLGRKVYQASANSTDYDNDTEFTLPELQSGVYTIRCYAGDDVHTFKVVVKR